MATVGVGSTRARARRRQRRRPTARLYARDLSRPMVFTVDATLLDDLKKKPDDLRKKDVFEFRSFSAQGIDVHGRRQDVHVRARQKAPASTDAGRAAGRPTSGSRRSPTAKDVDQSKITDFLTTMSNLRADTFATKAAHDRRRTGRRRRGSATRSRRPAKR